MHVAVDHVEEGSVLYELLPCISFTMFITQSELEVKRTHNRCNLLANLMKLRLSSSTNFMQRYRQILSIEVLLLT